MQTLDKPKRKVGEPVLSREAWDSLKMASISGTSDKDLAEIYEIAEGAIRARRMHDKTWAVAHGLRRKALGTQGAVSKHVKALTKSADSNKDANISAQNAEKAEKQAIQAIQATFADESQAARLLALQIGTKGLKSSLDGEGGLKPHLAPKEPAHVKVYAEIAAKAGQWGGDNQVTINCQAYAGSVIAPLSNESEDSIIDV